MEMGMKTAAFAVMLIGWVGLAMLLARIAVVVPETDAGLVNPGIRIELRPGTQVYFLAGLLAALIGSYIYTVVAWVEWRLKRLHASLPAGAEREASAQPREVKLLKDAIRAGDVAAVRRYAGEAAFSFNDECLLTPYELAELYGDPAVIAAVGEAFRRYVGRHPPGSADAPPPSRFAMGRRSSGGEGDG
jgi:hypothetical protein